MSQVENRLLEKGIEIGATPIPVAAYVPGVVSNNYVYTSGQLPMKNGKLEFKGCLGKDATLAEGYEAAKQSAINCLSVIKGLLGDLDRVTRVVKVVGYVNCSADFTDQPKVINGASELIQLAFGELGSHARSAVGVAALPLGAMCEVEITVEYK